MLRAPCLECDIAFVMARAVMRHLKAGEGIKGSMPALVLGMLAPFVTIGRFRIAPFGG